MPGAADDGDVAPELLACGTQLDPHVRLAHRVPGLSAVAVRLAESPHGLRQRDERRERVARVAPATRSARVRCGSGRAAVGALADIGASAAVGASAGIGVAAGIGVVAGPDVAAYTGAPAGFGGAAR